MTTEEKIEFAKKAMDVSQQLLKARMSNWDVSDKHFCDNPTATHEQLVASEREVARCWQLLEALEDEVRGKVLDSTNHMTFRMMDAIGDSIRQMEIQMMIAME